MQLRTALPESPNFEHLLLGCTVGMDVSSEEGLLLRVDTFLRLLKPEHFPRVKSQVVRQLRRRVAAETWFSKDDDFMMAVSRNSSAIESATAIADVCLLMSEIVSTRVSAITKSASETTVLSEGFPEDLPDLLLIQCLSRIVLPIEPRAIRVFWSSSVNGDVPLQVPLLEFDPDSCFTRRINRTGSAVARILETQDLHVSRWTTVSY